MLAPMSSRGKLGLSASYLCRVLSLLCILVPSTIPDNPFLVCPLLRPQLPKIHPIFIRVIPPWTLLFFICLRNYSLGFQWAHVFSILPSKKRCARLGSGKPKSFYDVILREQVRQARYQLLQYTDRGIGHPRDFLRPLARLQAMKLLRGFLRLFFFLCHIQARKKCFFLAVEQVNGILLPPMVASPPGSSSLELVLAVSLMALELAEKAEHSWCMESRSTK